MIANSAAMTHDPATPGKTLLPRGIMTEIWDGEDTLSIAIFDDTQNSGAARVATSLAAEISAAFGPRDEAPFSIIARAGETVAGGLNGATHWGWCYIRQLWVDAGWRRRGLGRRLLAEVETLARARLCVGLYVDTFDPDAAAFYERSGFARFGRIDDFPPGHARIFLRKTLVPISHSSG
jgi:ribosomal protein S18 acetylase RimI-like enzyme